MDFGYNCLGPFFGLQWLSHILILAFSVKVNREKIFGRILFLLLIPFNLKKKLSYLLGYMHDVLGFFWDI